MTRPRVGVNLAWLVPGVVGGSEEATLTALRAVDALARSAVVEPGAAGRLDPDVPEIVVVGTPALFDAHPDLVDRFEHRVVGARASKARRVLAETSELPAVLASARVDLVHHAGGVLPMRSPHPAVVAVHDIQPLDLPANFSRVKREYMARMLPRTVRSADALTVPSEFVRRRLVERLGAEAGRITVVPWSVPTGSSPTTTERDQARARHGLGRRFVLYPAIPYTHKNHGILLDTIAGLADVDLVLTGGTGPLDPELARRTTRPDLAGRVHRLGRVPERELGALLAEATVVAVPSRYEGFGLPALEALAAGRACVVSSEGSLPEVVGDAALVVDPDDLDGWSRAIRRLLDDDDERRRLEVAGPVVAASFSPHRTATALVGVWQRCLERSPTSRTTS